LFELTLYEKSLLATLLLVLAVGQFIAIGVARGWIGRYPPETRRRAAAWHRTEGYVALLIILIVAYECVFVIGPRYHPVRVAVHSVLGTSVVALIWIKVSIGRVFRRKYRWQPAVGKTLLGAVVLLWLSSAGWYFLQDYTGLLTGR
jgi:hypothetical protein